MPQAAEIRGCVCVIVEVVRVLGTHLSAFKETHAPKFVGGAPVVSIVDETVVLYEQSEGQSKAETVLRGDAILNIMGQVSPDLFNAGVLAVEAASKQQFNNNLPEFMITALESMKNSAENNRQQMCDQLRIISETLRDDLMLSAASALFTDTFERAAESLRLAIESAEKPFKAALKEASEKRKAHEGELRPSLANPNSAGLLKDLREREAARHEAAMEAIGVCEEKVALILKEEPRKYLKSFAAHFEAMVGSSMPCPSSPTSPPCRGMMRWRSPACR